MARPPKPYSPRTEKNGDGHSYVSLEGGPLHGAWFRNYPPLEEFYVSNGAVYKLTQNETLDDTFPEDRQVTYLYQERD